MIRCMQVVTAVCVLGLLPSGVCAQEPDKEGCKDHPMLTRMPGFRISDCVAHDFDSHEFVTGRDQKTTIEGIYTEIRYALQEGAKEPSRLQIHRNYENAMARIGGKTTGRDDDGNLYLTYTTNGAEVRVHINSYVSNDFTLYVVEKAPMKQDIVANAETLAGGLEAEGKIAIYGILFDTGKADVKPESEPVLVEIAKLLKSQPTLKLYVVGHTDNTAALDLNVTLSRARADAVVQALVTKYGIAAARLKGQGVGPLVPVASNDTEDGRAKNRRVELVRQ
jgi:OmpA-OmpF porin, OOP family